MSGIKLLDSHLTEENHVERLDRARGKTKRQIEVLVAEWAPKADVPARMRKLPDVRVGAAALQPSRAPQACGTAPTSIAALQAESAPPSDSILPSAGAHPVALQVMPAVPVIQTAPSQTFALQPVPARRSRLTPLSPGRYNVSVTLGQEGHDQLEQLQDLLRHQNPSGDLGSIITRAVRELNEREMKKRFAQVKVPRQVAREHARPGPKVNAQSKPNASKSRYVPRKVFREVYTRDDGQCTLVSPGGRRCTARGFLDVHHHGVTYARDGEATVENLRLACRAHNLFLAYQDYGRRFMQDKLLEAVRKKRAGKSFQGRVQS